MKFYKPMAFYYKEIFPLKKKKLDFLESYIEKIKPPGRILDVGCAVGQCTSAMTQSFPEINFTGIDLDAEMIEIAKNENTRLHPRLEFQLMNMNDLNIHFKPATFDLVYCLGNTLVHLPSLEDIKKVLRSFQNILKPGGACLLQVVNYNSVLEKRTETLPLIETPRIRFERRYGFHPDDKAVTFKFQLEIKETGERVGEETVLFPLTFEKLRMVLDELRLEKTEFFGNFDKVPYSVDSPGLICAARKKTT